MSNNWTKDQLDAIENRGGTLLVSAAAGSGKTAVLVERVIRRITDDKNPADIDSFLIVTYTNAAAAEMREKIASAVSKRLQENHKDARLKRQLYLLHKAQITTVHSFCLSLAREHFNALDLSPDFRICDENESNMIKQEVLEDVIEDFYQRDNNEGFTLLVDILSAGRDDKKLFEVVLETYSKIQSHAHPKKFLQKIRGDYIGEGKVVADTEWGTRLFSYAKTAVEYAIQCLTFAIEQITEYEEVAEKYLDAFSYDLKCAKGLLEQIEECNWQGVLDEFDKCAFARLSAVKGFQDKEFLENVKSRRDVWKDTVKKLKTEYFCYTEAEIQEDRTLISSAVCALADVVESFMDRFAEEKRQRNLVDFNDLEHFAVNLLIDHDGNKTRIASDVAKRYTEIMVDEYQDTNEVQDFIFNAVSNDGQNIFMVGDVKQSIYRFRLANPWIFLGKYKLFVFSDVAKEGESRKIVLSKNFRSRHEVLQSTNYIFSNVMTEEFGDIDYDENEYLYKGATFEEDGHERYKTEFCVLDMNEMTGEEEEETPEKAQLEAQYTAQRIHDMIKSGFCVFDKDLQRMRGAVASDFAILLRSKSKMEYYKKELQRFSIGATCEVSEGLLNNIEVSVIVSMLQIIDNPRQEVPLIGVLRSPLVGFTDEELAAIRNMDKKAEFYDVLQLCAMTGNQKVSDFLNKLAELRIYSKDMPVYMLIWKLYDETNALGIYGAMENGGIRQQNLISFFERARAYEGQGYKGIFKFVNLIRNMLENGEDFSVTNSDENENQVKIMTIHKSKGLEFPIVFLCDCAKLFNETDLRKPVLIHSELGIGPKCKNLNNMTQYPTVQRYAIASSIRNETMSEELRVLYVAMTRAKEKLIITCAFKNAASTISKWASIAEMEQIPAYALSQSRTMAMWLVMPLLKHPKGGDLRAYSNSKIDIDVSAPDVWEIKTVSFESEPNEENLQVEEQEVTTKLKAKPTFEYERCYLKDIPSKLTATSIKEITDSQICDRIEENEDNSEIINNANTKVFRRPYFDKEKRGLTSAEKGVAHHLVMQFADFSVCDTIDGIKAEVTRLKDLKIISDLQADSIDAFKLLTFFQSDVYHRMENSKNIWREFKFSVLIPVSEYYNEAVGINDEKVLLQGVVDCMFEDDDGIVIIDFKTDKINSKIVSERTEQYKMQLDAYARAIAEIFDKKVHQKVLFFFETAQTIIV